MESRDGDLDVIKCTAIGLALIAVIAAPGIYMNDWTWSYGTGVGLLIVSGLGFMWWAMDTREEQ